MTAFQWGVTVGTVLCAIGGKKMLQDAIDNAYKERMKELTEKAKK